MRRFVRVPMLRLKFVLVLSEPGLEAYPCLEIHNLGSQVANSKLFEMCKKLNPDAVLISQFVTEKGMHLRNLEEFVMMASGLRKKPLLIAGGPRLDEREILAIGFNGVFGPGTLPSDVFSFMAQNLVSSKINSTRSI